MKHFIIASIVLLLTACAKTPDWDYDKSVQFANYKTFAWSQEANLENQSKHYQINDLMEKRIRNAVTRSLNTQGITLTDAENADVLINYHVSVDKKLEVDSFNTTYSARWNYWGWGWQTDTYTREYETGTLVIDVVDRASNQLVWRGAKEGRLKTNLKPDQRTEQINKTVSEILKNFPPQAQ